MSLKATSVYLSIMKLGKNIVSTDLIQSLILPNADRKMKTAVQHACPLYESINIVHVDDDSTVDL